jgi:hypothetical protein
MTTGTAFAKVQARLSSPIRCSGCGDTETEKSAIAIQKKMDIRDSN